MKSFIGLALVTILLLCGNVLGDKMTLLHFKKCHGQETGWVDFLLSANGGLFDVEETCIKNPICKEPSCTSHWCIAQCTLERLSGVINGDTYNVTRHNEINKDVLTFDRKNEVMAGILMIATKQKFTTDNDCKVFQEVALAAVADFDMVCSRP